MFAGIRQFARHVSEMADALQGLQEHVRSLSVGWAEGSDLAARLEALERGRALWEAEIESELKRSDEAYKRARAAEERARYHAARSGVEVEVGDEEGAQDLEDAWRAFLASYGGGGPANGVQPMHEDVGGDRGGPTPYYLRVKGR